MTGGMKLIIRALLSLGGAILLSRFFMPKAGWITIGAMAIGLLVMAYVSEYARRKG
jgi:hypothetical protein